MSDHFLTMLSEAAEVTRRFDDAARLLAASRDFRVIGSPWRFIFAANGKTLILSCVGEEFRIPPEWSDAPYVGFRPIPLPVTIGLEEASKRLDDFPPPFSEVMLSWPLVPGADQPCYLFVKEKRAKIVGAMGLECGSAATVFESGD